MITSINEWKQINENSEKFNINDIKDENELYHEILELGLKDTTSNIQRKRGNLEFTTTQPELDTNMKNIIIYANGKIRRTIVSGFSRNRPSYIDTPYTQHISFDLKRPPENEKDATLCLSKVYNSIIRHRQKTTEADVNDNTNQ